jgi:hypothetical protein
MKVPGAFSYEISGFAKKPHTVKRKDGCGRSETVREWRDALILRVPPRDTTAEQGAEEDEADMEVTERHRFVSG